MCVYVCVCVVLCCSLMRRVALFAGCVLFECSVFCGYMMCVLVWIVLFGLFISLVVRVV